MELLKELKKYPLTELSNDTVPGEENCEKMVIATSLNNNADTDSDDTIVDNRDGAINSNSLESVPSLVNEVINSFVCFPHS